MTPANHDLLVRYLLGNVSEPERERLEEEYFLNDEMCEALEAVEDELIDSYVCGRLSQSQREQFDKYFLDYPTKHERVEFAKIFMDAAKREEAVTAPMRAVEQPNSWWQSVGSYLLGRRTAARLAFAAAWLAVAMVATFLGLQTQRLRWERTEFQQQIHQLQQQEAKMEQQVPDVFMLPASHLARGAGSSNPSHGLAISATSSSVILLLDLERDEFSHYDAILQSAEGKQIWHVERLRSQPIKNGHIAIAFYLPSQLLNRGDYNILLFGRSANDKLQIADSYEFSVVR